MTTQAWPPAEMDLTLASRAELKALDEMEREGHWTVAGHEVRVTNLDKVMVPAEGDHEAVTKRDVLRYYATIGPTLLPHLAGRGLNLQRFPDGTRRVSQIAEITGMEGDVIQMQTLYEFIRTGTDSDGTVRGEMRATGLRPKFLEVLRLSGVDVSADMFDPRKV